jgi:FKBP-type peptidyl-prolyl cis-trans isomerase FklB
MSRDLEGTDDSISAAPFHAGFLAGVKQDTTLFKADKARELFEKRSTAARDERNRVYKKENEEWLANNATKPGVVTLPSGLQYKVLKEGNGAKPKATDKVDVIYEGKTINGKVFDATANHGGKKTDSFRCDQVIKGWTEALTNMPVGSKWEIYIPQNLAYGERQAGQIKPYSTLIFTVELVNIEPEAKPAVKAADNVKTSTSAKTAAKKTRGSKK